MILSLAGENWRTSMMQSLIHDFFRKPLSGVAVLQPVFQITDPYLNLFRGILPPIFGLDLSPILAFVLLNALTSATAAVGAEMSESDKKKLQAASVFAVKPYKK